MNFLLTRQNLSRIPTIYISLILTILYSITVFLLYLSIKPLILSMGKPVMLQLTLNQGDIWKLKSDQSDLKVKEKYCELLESKTIKVKSLSLNQNDHPNHYKITLDDLSSKELKNVCPDLKPNNTPGYLYIKSPIIIFTPSNWLSQLLKNNIDLLIILLSDFIFFLFVYFFLKLRKKNNVPNATSDEGINSLSSLITSIKEQVLKAQENARELNKNAILVQGDIKVNLKTTIVKGQSGNFELKPVTLNQNISNEKIQEITIDLNPLKVFSDLEADMKVEFHHPNINSINAHITSADLVSINDKNYLWYKGKKDSEDTIQEWVDASNFKKITLSKIKTEENREEEKKKTRLRYILPRYSWKAKQP